MKKFVHSIALTLLIACEMSATLPLNSEKEQTYDLPPLCPALKKELFSFIAAYHETPQAYILNTFKEHDIVFLGEFSLIQQQLQFLRDLIPLLHESGIHNLGIEYALHEDQPLIDSLLTSNIYDASLAQRLLFRHSPLWGYEEYADLFRVAWELNRNREQGSKPFRIVGLNVNALADEATPRADSIAPHELMASVIMDEFVDKDEQALIFSGFHHAFTEYRLPAMNDATGEFEGFTERYMGNIIYARIGKRAITVLLHSPWINAKGYEYPYVFPVDGMVDALIASLPTFYQCVGFDVKGTPFGTLPAKKTLYKYGYDTFLFSHLCDGYICLGTLSTYRGVSPIEHFITDDLLEEAKSRSAAPAFMADSITAEHFNAFMQKNADIPYRFRELE